MTIDGIKCYCPKNKFLNEQGKCEFVNHCERTKNGEFFFKYEKIFNSFTFPTF